MGVTRRPTADPAVLPTASAVGDVPGSAGVLDGSVPGGGTASAAGPAVQRKFERGGVASQDRPQTGDAQEESAGRQHQRHHDPRDVQRCDSADSSEGGPNPPRPAARRVREHGCRRSRGTSGRSALSDVATSSQVDDDFDRPPKHLKPLPESSHFGASPPTGCRAAAAARGRCRAAPDVTAGYAATGRTDARP